MRVTSTATCLLTEKNFMQKLFINAIRKALDNIHNVIVMSVSDVAILLNDIMDINSRAREDLELLSFW